MANVPEPAPLKAATLSVDDVAREAQAMFPDRPDREFLESLALPALQRLDVDA